MKVILQQDIRGKPVFLSVIFQYIFYLFPYLRVGHDKQQMDHRPS